MHLLNFNCVRGKNFDIILQDIAFFNLPIIKLKSTEQICVSVVKTQDNGVLSKDREESGTRSGRKTLK